MTAVGPVVVLVTLLVLAFAGFAAGSVVNLLIDRVPDRLPVLDPGPTCPSCGAEFLGTDRWALLLRPVGRGRCPACRAPIPLRHRAVEASTAALWAGVGWWAWVSEDGLALLPLLLVLTAAGVALWCIDVEHHRLPDAIVLPLYPITVVGLAFAGLVAGSWPFVDVAVGIGVWLLVVGGVWLVSLGSGMGFGDVKLAPVLGATLGWLGWEVAVLGLILAFVGGGLTGVYLLVTRRAGRGSHLAFGPFLLLGAGVAMVLGQWTTEAYLSGVGL